MSDGLIDRMAAALGNPSFDPHGDPIPARDGSIAEVIYTPLDDLPVGETVLIRQADTSDAERLRYLAEIGLRPGAEVVVVAHEPFGGPVTVRVGGEQRMVGRELAALVLCQRRRPVVPPGPLAQPEKLPCYPIARTRSNASSLRIAFRQHLARAATDGQDLAARAGPTVVASARSVDL